MHYLDDYQDWEETPQQIKLNNTMIYMNHTIER